MNENEVYDLLQVGNLTITFDTNALYNSRTFFNICDKINLINIKLKYEIKLIISSLVHAEKLFDLKQEKGDIYDIDFINKTLIRKKVRIAPFEYRHAEAVAQLIGRQFPTDKEWKNFKRQKCMSCLGLTETEKKYFSFWKKMWCNR
jgi:hypothetical protein